VQAARAIGWAMRASYDASHPAQRAGAGGDLSAVRHSRLHGRTGGSGFLGFGLPPGTPSWGDLLRQGSENIVNHPHLVYIRCWRLRAPCCASSSSGKPSARRSIPRNMRVAMSQPLLSIENSQDLPAHEEGEVRAVDGIYLQVEPGKTLGSWESPARARASPRIRSAPAAGKHSVRCGKGPFATSATWRR